jgi:hypothetical protein
MLIHLLLVTSVVLQQKIALTKPDAEYAEPFTSVRGVRELPTGKVLVSDVQDKVVQIIDFTAGTGVKVGREGQGPEEYMLPMGLFAMPDGSTVLQDMGNRRFLPILADGKLGKPFSPPTPPPPSNPNPPRSGMVFVGAGLLLNVRGADAQGHLYFQGMATPATEGSSAADSVPIMTWDRKSPQVDTIAWLPIPPGERPVVSRQGNRETFSIRMGGGGAWPKQTAWTPAPDGRIAIVSPDPYRVTWLSGKTRAAGPVIPVAAHKVTEADKKEWLDRQSRARPIVLAIGGPGGNRGGPPPRIPPPSAEETEWPETLPAFSGMDAVQMTPEGQVWVQRVKPASDKTPSYDVFDGAGKLVGAVTLRPRSRVVGFGKGTVYVVRTDDDDLQYLERFKR